VVQSESGFVRIAVGPAGNVLEAQQRALTALAAAPMPSHVRAQIPWPLDRGREGLATWSLEPRLAGTVAGPVPEPGILSQCEAFLADLHLSGRGIGEPVSCAGSAALLARTFPPHAEALEELARQLDLELAQIPRGFAHGDFWSGNLLVRDGALSGVVDWAAAGPGRLPLLDLFHLHIGCRRERAGLSLGSAFLAYADARTDAETAAIRAYCARVGVSPSDGENDALLAAYWLEALARELADPDRAVDVQDASWLDENLDAVIEVLGRVEARCTMIAG
jgi:hypothetical protein